MAQLKRPGQGSAISVAGNLEPIEPVYTKPNRPTPLASTYVEPDEPAMNYLNAPVVSRHEVTAGMRYLYSDMRQVQKVSPLGTGPDLGVAVWSSSFQKVLGTLRDYGFYDLLFRAGYPGFNLGLSFKVQQNPSVGGQGPGNNIHMKSPNIKTVITNPFKRATNSSASMTG